MTKQTANVKIGDFKVPEGKPEVLGWFNQDLELVEKDDAEIVKVRFPDDGVITFFIIDKE